jgi:hypothetical protein
MILTRLVLCLLEAFGEAADLYFIVLAQVLGYLLRDLILAGQFVQTSERGLCCGQSRLRFLPFARPVIM